MNLATLLHKITQNTLVLTANKRLSRFLMLQYHAWQKQQEKPSWETITCLPLPAWLEQNWRMAQTQNHTKGKILLTAQQEQFLWSQILQKVSRRESFSLANQALKTWEMIRSWQIPLNHDEFQKNASEGTWHFLRWANELNTVNQQNHWLDRASLIFETQKLIASGALILPREIILVGFLEITPAIHALLAACQAQGSSVEIIQLEKNNTEPRPLCDDLAMGVPKGENRDSPPLDVGTNLFRANIEIPKLQAHKMTFLDTQHEISTMALWAKKCLEENSLAQIACIVPDLTSMRNQLEALFLEVFPSADYFNLSLGTSLKNEPIIHVFFYLLRLLNEPLSSDEISHLIRSPFLGHSFNETRNRSRLDTQLQNHRQWKYHFTDFLLFIKNHETDPVFQEAFDAIDALLKATDFHSLCTPSFWAVFISRVLHAGKWPGTRALTSREHQAVQHWFKVLDEFSSLDLFQKKMPFDQALKTLTFMAQEMIFQPKNAEAPIQILGILEAESIPFSRVWIMDLTDKNWPSPASPNPFVPLSLQRKWNTPHSSSEREYQFCQHALNRLIQTNEAVILSFPKQKDGQPCRPSPLLAKIPALDLSQLSLPPFHSRNHRQFAENRLALASLSDQKAPSVDSTKKVSGGTQVFKLQSACPFRAFAELRLSAKPFDPPTFGLNALEKGSAVHEVLERAWGEIKTHQNLQELSEPDLKRTILDNINLVLLPFTSQKKISATWLELEKKRLLWLLTRWFELEKKRSPFEAHALEQWRKIEIANLSLSVKIDRMDRELDGTYTLIDYKTSNKVSAKNWEGERPDEPQLPLYLITAQEPIHTIAFGILHAQLVGFKLMSSRKAALPGKNNLEKDSEEKWGQLLQTWPIVLHALANHFQQGEAQVSPKNKQQTCVQCHLKTLCRIGDGEKD